MTALVPASGRAIAQAVAVLRAGGIVGFPTETYYGLAVDPFNLKAVDRLFRVKQRSRLLPLLVLVQSKDHVRDLVRTLPASALRLIERYWPGPLTLVCPARPDLPSQLTGGTGTIGFRQSSHAVAAQLVAMFGCPVTATSANISGAPAAVTAAATVAGAPIPAAPALNAFRVIPQPIRCSARTLSRFP